MKRFFLEHNQNYAREVLRVGFHVRSNSSGSQVFEPVIEGIIGEIDERRIYVWQNTNDGTRGSSNPNLKGFKYSWAVTFDGSNSRWIEYEPLYFKVHSTDAFDDRLILENIGIVQMTDALDGGRPVFKILDHKKWEVIEKDVQEIGRIEYIVPPLGV